MYRLMVIAIILLVIQGCASKKAIFASRNTETHMLHIMLYLPNGEWSWGVHSFWSEGIELYHVDIDSNVIDIATIDEFTIQYDETAEKTQKVLIDAGTIDIKSLSTHCVISINIVPVDKKHGLLNGVHKVFGCKIRNNTEQLKELRISK
jgi:hypothetical protein